MLIIEELLSPVFRTVVRINLKVITILKKQLKGLPSCHQHPDSNLAKILSSYLD